MVDLYTDYEKIMEALNALSGSAGCLDVAVRMRKPGDWYVDQNVEVKDMDCLEGRYGNGETPYGAILDHWNKLTNLAPHEYLVVNAMRSNRKAYRWNGFMWAEVDEKKR